MSFLLKMASCQTQLHHWENTMNGVKQTFKDSGVITTEHLHPSVGLSLCYTDLHRASILPSYTLHQTSASVLSPLPPPANPKFPSSFDSVPEKIDFSSQR